MLAEIGRRADFALTRATEVVHEGAPPLCSIYVLPSALPLPRRSRPRPASRWTLLYTDFRGDSEFPGWDAALAEMPLRQVSAPVINHGVIRSLDENAERPLELVGGRLPAFMRPFGQRFAGMPGTGI